VAQTPVEVARLLSAIEQFEARAPRDLPQGVMEKIAEIKQEVSQVTPSRDTPGMREAEKLMKPGQAGDTGESGTGVHFSKAASGPDAPSPGQREAMNVSQEISKAAQTIMERVNGGTGTQAPSGEPAEAR
jgi:hypothetical protein